MPVNYSSFQAPTNVLLIEDRISDVELVRHCLQSSETEKFDVFHAVTMATALPLMAEKNIHAVVLDLFLPDTHELDGLSSIQSMSPNLPVLILTGRDDEELASKAVERGAQDYLLKDKITTQILQRSIRYAIRRKHFENVIITQANFDKLTGLPNRELFQERLKAALARQQRSRQQVGLMLIDLNEFKAVNDTFGHDAGDILLKEVAHRLPQCLRPYDVAARLGGDEFVVLIEDVKQVDDCCVIARKLISAVEKLVIIEPWRISVGASIGIATCADLDNLTPEMLMRRADEAMYCAKQDPKSSYRFYNSEHAVLKQLH